MASIISWQFIGLPCSPRTLAAASRALILLASGCFLPRLPFAGAALLSAAVPLRAGVPLAIGWGCSSRDLFLVVFLLAAMSGLPKRVAKLRIARCDALQGQDSYLAAASTSRQFRAKLRSFFRRAGARPAAMSAAGISECRRESP